MEAVARKALGVSLFAVVYITAIFSSMGCQPSEQMAVSPTNPMCPACGQAAQAQQLADLDVTRVVCPVCGDVETIDPRFVERLEVFMGGPVGDTVYACANCRALVEQCATCRLNGGAVARQNKPGWQ